VGVGSGIEAGASQATENIRAAEALKTLTTALATNVYQETLMVDAEVQVPPPPFNPKACSVEGCERASTRKGLCDTHYRRLKRHGATGGPIVLRPPLPDLCAIEGCGKKPDSRLDGVAYCKTHYFRMRKRGTPNPIDYGRQEREACIVDGCHNKPASRYGDYCQKHYAKAARHGDPLWERPHKKGGFNAQGYEWVHVESGHALSTSRHRVYKHRMVLFDEIGEGPHQCHWCGKTVFWNRGRQHNALVVDHLDGDKSHNDLPNLVPSCSKCNINRAVFMDWVKKHIDDPALRALFAFNGTGTFVL
jgi:hypothetical protein